MDCEKQFTHHMNGVASWLQIKQIGVWNNKFKVELYSIVVEKDYMLSRNRLYLYNEQAHTDVQLSNFSLTTCVTRFPPPKTKLNWYFPKWEWFGLHRIKTFSISHIITAFVETSRISHSLLLLLRHHSARPTEIMTSETTNKSIYLTFLVATKKL